MLADMPSTLIIIVLAVLLWTLIVAFLLFALKYLAYKRDNPPAPPPPEPSVTVISNAITKAVTEVAGQITQKMGDAMIGSSKALGEALQAAFAAPPSAQRDEMLQRVQHELNQWAAEADVDDSDPIGDSIMPRERPDAAFVDMDDDMPMGVPGLRMPVPGEG